MIFLSLLAIPHKQTLGTRMFSIHTNKRDKHECSQSIIYRYVLDPKSNHQYILLRHAFDSHQYIPLMHVSNHHQYILLMHEFNIQPSKNFKTLFIINIISKYYYSYFKSKSFVTSCLIHFQKTITCKQSLKYSTTVLNNL